MDFSNLDVQKYIDLGVEMVASYAPKLLLALVVLFVGLKAIKLLNKILDKIFAKQHLDPSVAGFLESLIAITLKIVLFIAVAGMLGVQTSSFVALVGAAGLAVGLALQGSLANFAGGVLILLFKPYKVGDHILAQGYDGVVKQIQIFNTVLHTPDHKKIIIPNGAISNDAIENYTSLGTRRHDIIFGIGYEDDIKKAKDILLNLAKDNKKILKEKGHEPEVFVGNLGESSVDLNLRVWCQDKHYVGLPADFFELAKAEFDANGINIPYPQQDIHHYYETKDPTGKYEVEV